ncbi:MAG: SDR family NAD(P)-dependent oxidoreductase [Draconibacterium sp.]|nr:SDR family NAD(P)-dependent oxidoreductase [Draconibacterium sp.]
MQELASKLPLNVQKGDLTFFGFAARQGLESFSDELRKNYPVDVHHLSIDLTKRKSPQKVFEYAQQHQLTINILVNNAGLGFNGKLEELKADLIDTMILLNVRASTLLTFLFIPGMKKLKKAYILNISSFAAFSPLPYKSVYAATKTYLLFFTQALNRELKETGISVTSVHPNGISSERAMENIKKSSFIARSAALTPAQVAKISLDNMFSENVFVIPGVVNKIYYYIGCSLPHGVILKLIGNIFKKS